MPQPDDSNQPTTMAVLPRTIVILGASYAGGSAGYELLKTIPTGWRVLIVNRNSHFNHLYSFPRYSLLTQHTHKAFIPMAHRFTSPHAYLHASATSISSIDRTVTLSRSFPELGNKNIIHWDYLVYALGASLPEPINLSNTAKPDCLGTKEEGRKALVRVHEKIQELIGSDGELSLEKLKLEESTEVRREKRILVVGGGALGIQLASDIKEIYPALKVTLLHSRKQLLPRFNAKMHDEVVRRFDELGVECILGERAVVPSEGLNGLVVSPKTVVTTTGREIACDLVLLCTGQTPQTSLLAAAYGSDAIVDPTERRIRVLPTTQVANAKKEVVGEGRVFAVGDCAASGAIQAGYTGYNQALVAAKNIVKLIEGTDAELDKYEVDQPEIKVTLGLKNYAVQGENDFKFGDDGVEDLKVVEHFWAFHQAPTDDLYL